MIKVDYYEWDRLTDIQGDRYTDILTDQPTDRETYRYEVNDKIIRLYLALFRSCMHDNS